MHAPGWSWLVFGSSLGLALIVTLTLVLVWRLMPDRKQPCTKCNGPMQRIRRRLWHRALSLAFPVWNMRCLNCERTRVRRFKTR